MTSAYAVEFYKSDGSGATPILWLEADNADVTDSFSIEPIDIPGLIWNIHFNSVSVTAKWIITGKFCGSGSASIDGATISDPFTFMKGIRSFFKSIDSATGDYVGSASKRDAFAMKLNQWRDNLGTPEVKTYDIYGGYSNNSVQVICENLNLRFSAGAPNVVEYTITLLEVSEVMRL